MSNVYLFYENVRDTKLFYNIFLQIINVVSDYRLSNKVISVVTPNEKQ